MSDASRKARELVHAAAPAPWAWDADLECLGCADPAAPLIIYEMCGDMTDENAALIAAAPALLAELASEVERLEADSAKLRSLISEAVALLDGYPVDLGTTVEELGDRAREALKGE